LTLRPSYDTITTPAEWPGLIFENLREKQNSCVWDIGTNNSRDKVRPVRNSP
jgi:hypothetical protein